MKTSKHTTEQAVIEALDALEKSAIPASMASASAANGGLSNKVGELPKDEVSASESEDATTGMAKAEEEEEASEENSAASSEEGSSPESTSTPDSTSTGEEEPKMSKSKRRMAKCETSSSTSSKAGKSFVDEAYGDAAIRKGMDASEFLEALVEKIGDQFDEMNKSLDVLAEALLTHNEGMRKAIVAMGNQQIELSKSLGAYGDEPADNRRSLLHKSEEDAALNRPMPGDDDPKSVRLSKGQVLSVLDTMMKKGELQDPVLVTQYETSGQLPQEVIDRIEEGVAAGEFKFRNRNGVA